MLEEEEIKKATEAIKEEKVVIFPTDTVYGLLADAASKKAVDKVFKIKGRSKEKPLPVFVKKRGSGKKISHSKKRTGEFSKKSLARANYSSFRSQKKNKR